MNPTTLSIADSRTSQYPTTDIFIKTCEHDKGYHEYCVKSIHKYCDGFRNLVVVDDGGKEPPRPYLDQQRVKMLADTFTDAEFILVTDSDTLFHCHITPDTLKADGKPIWIHTPWTPEMLENKGVATWKRVMTQFFGQEPPSEFMRRQPFYFPRHVLQTLREYCRSRHGKTLEDYIMQSEAFSEWNVLGFHCWLHHRDEFHWIDSSKDELPPLMVNQMWSHTPLEWNLPAIHRILELPNP